MEFNKKDKKKYNRLSVNDRKMIEELYKKGIDAGKIQKRLEIEYNLDAIRRYIQRNLKHLKDMHLMNQRHTYETLRKTKMECSREISDMSFVKYNRSIYKTNKSGNLVVDKKVAPVVTFDTPNILKPRI